MFDKIGGCRQYRKPPLEDCKEVDQTIPNNAPALKKSFFNSSTHTFWTFIVAINIFYRLGNRHLVSIHLLCSLSILYIYGRVGR